MTITDHIVQYAAQRRGVFRKKDLSAWFDSMGIPVGKGLQTQLNRLVASNRLTKTGWGEYQIGTNTKPRLQLTLKPGTEEVGPPKSLSSGRILHLGCSQRHPVHASCPKHQDDYHRCGANFGAILSRRAP